MVPGTAALRGLLAASSSRGISRIVAAVESEISRSSAAQQFAVSVKCDFESFVYGWYAALLFRSAL